MNHYRLADLEREKTRTRPPDEYVCKCGAIVASRVETDHEGSTFEYLETHYALKAEHAQGSGMCDQSDSYPYGLVEVPTNKEFVTSCVRDGRHPDLGPCLACDECRYFAPGSCDR